MAEKIEFIPANELPEAEGEEVSVLCLENGELKQKPGASLGGGNYDAVVTVTVEGENTTMALTSGTYEDLRAKLENGQVPKVRFEGTLNYGDDYTFYADSVAAFFVPGDNTVEFSFACFYYDYWVAIHNDGTIEHW